MILSDSDIKKAIDDKKIVIIPSLNEEQFNSSSLDLRLNSEFKEYNPSTTKQPAVELTLDFSKMKYNEIARSFLRDVPKERDGSITIKPGAFVLGQTLEKITLPIESQLAARVEGRSSTARIGLVVHLSAPTIHAGFSGKITLEIINQGPFFIRLDPNKDRICQLIFEQIASKPTKANLSEFQNQESVAGSPPK